MFSLTYTNPMSRYSIKELERLSGIKAHTIRIWEKRYQIIHPARTQTNIRYYSDEDLKKIINISLLNNNGVKISKIAKLPFKQLIRKVQEVSESKFKVSTFVDKLVLAAIDLDEVAFSKIMGELVARMGFENTVLTVLYPFLEKVGVLWHTNGITPGQEHFISVLIRQKIITAIDSLSYGAKKSRAVLFLPEQELHELGLLFYHYITRKAGFKTFYLGQMLPFDDLAAICESHKPSVLITCMTSVPSPFSTQEYVNKLARQFPGCAIFISGYTINSTAIRIPSNVRIFSTATDLKRLLKNVK